MLDSIEQHVQQLELKNNGLDATFDTIEWHIDDELDLVGDDVDRLMHKVGEMMTRQPSAKPTNRSQFTAFSNIHRTFKFSCPHERQIFITGALLARFDNPNKNCWRRRCPPNHAMDCRESMEERDPERWRRIKAYCDNKTTCEIELYGISKKVCEEDAWRNNWVSYVQVFYECLPDDVTGPVSSAGRH